MTFDKLLRLLRVAQSRNDRVAIANLRVRLRYALAR